MSLHQVNARIARFMGWRDFVFHGKGLFARSPGSHNLPRHKVPNYCAAHNRAIVVKYLSMMQREELARFMVKMQTAHVEEMRREPGTFVPRQFDVWLVMATADTVARCAAESIPGPPVHIDGLTICPPTEEHDHDGSAIQTSARL